MGAIPTSSAIFDFALVRYDPNEFHGVRGPETLRDRPAQDPLSLSIAVDEDVRKRAAFCLIKDMPSII